MITTVQDISSSMRYDIRKYYNELPESERIILEDKIKNMRSNKDDIDRYDIQDNTVKVHRFISNIPLDSRYIEVIGNRIAGYNDILHRQVLYDKQHYHAKLARGVVWHLKNKKEEILNHE